MPKSGSKPVLAVDIDEVLFPFAPELLRWSNEREGTQHTVDDMGDFYFSFWGLSAEAAIERVHEFSRLDQRQIEPMTGAVEAVRRLHDRYRVVIVTSRDPEFEAGTRAWLEHYFGGLYEEFVMTGNPYSGRAYRGKVAECRRLGAVLLVDDQLRYMEEAAAQGLPGLLFGDYPWNRAERLPPGVRRVRDWPEVERVLAHA